MQEVGFARLDTVQEIRIGNTQTVHGIQGGFCTVNDKKRIRFGNDRAIIRGVKANQEGVVMTIGIVTAIGGDRVIHHKVEFIVVRITTQEGRGVADFSAVMDVSQTTLIHIFLGKAGTDSNRRTIQQQLP